MNNAKATILPSGKGPYSVIAMSDACTILDPVPIVTVNSYRVACMHAARHAKKAGRYAIFEAVTLYEHEEASVPEPEPPRQKELHPDAVLVRKREVAKACGVSQRCIDNWMRRRLIPFIKLSARCVRFELPEVQKALLRLQIEAVQ